MGKGVKIALIVAAIVFLLSIWQRKNIMESISGIVETPPEQLAKADGVTVEIESLARAMESEESSNTARIAIGWAIKNYAKKHGKSITQTVTAGNPNSKGKYGKQDLGGRYCTTFKSPSRSTLELASKILSNAITDPTKGSSQWDAPKAQAALHAKNPGKYKTPEQIAASRQSEGKRLVTVEGVPNTRFWA